MKYGSSCLDQKMWMSLEQSGFSKHKMDENGVIVRNKARLVAQRFKQIEGIDFMKPLLQLQDLIPFEYS